MSVGADARPRDPLALETGKRRKTANKTVTEPKYGWSRLKNMLITWKEII
jgi:hypothetical protein